MRMQTGETLLHSGREDDGHMSGVVRKLFISWPQVNDRIFTAGFNSRYVTSEPPVYNVVMKR